MQHRDLIPHRTTSLFRCLQDDFLKKNLQLLNASTRSSWPDYVCFFWRGTRMQLMGAVVNLVAGVFVSLYSNNAGFAGLALLYAGFMQSTSMHYTLYLIQ